MEVSTLRPGLLVALRTEVHGGVEYQRYNVEDEHITARGSKRAKWNTTREIDIPEEYELAVQCRSKCRSLITSVCTESKFGLLCPENEREALDAAINMAVETATQFNRISRLTKVSIYAIVGRVAQDDVQAVRAINAEVQGLMESMEAGIRNFDVEVIREAATKAKNMGRMLDGNVNEKVKLAVEAARAAARRIVKAGETAGKEVDEVAIRAIRHGRAQFIDLDDNEEEMAAPVATNRILDVDMNDEEMQAPAPRLRPRLDLEEAVA